MRLGSARQVHPEDAAVRKKLPESPLRQQVHRAESTKGEFIPGGRGGSGVVSLVTPLNHKGYQPHPAGVFFIQASHSKNDTGCSI